MLLKIWRHIRKKSPQNGYEVSPPFERQGLHTKQAFCLSIRKRKMVMSYHTPVSSYLPPVRHLWWYKSQKALDLQFINNWWMSQMSSIKKCFHKCKTLKKCIDANGSNIYYYRWTRPSVIIFGTSLVRWPTTTWKRF